MLWQRPPATNEAVRTTAPRAPPWRRLRSFPFFLFKHRGRGAHGKPPPVGWMYVEQRRPSRCARCGSSVWIPQCAWSRRQHGGAAKRDFFDASPAGESGCLPRPNGGTASTCRTRSSCGYLLTKRRGFRLDGTRRKIARLASRFIRILRRSSARESRHPVLVFAMARCSGLRFSVRFSYSRPRPISRLAGRSSRPRAT